MQYVLRYDAKPGMSGAFRDWMRENEHDFKDHAAEGWHYLGTWFTVRVFGDSGVETRWEIDDYAALGSGFGDETAIRLANDWFEFVDQSRPMRATLLKSAAEVDVLPGQ